MLIAISQRQQYNKYNAPIDVLEHAYPLFFDSCGIRILPLPNIPSQVEYYFDHFPIKGIILTGGEDIDPKIYGENIEWPNLSPFRDQTEKKLVEIAVAQKIPVLGLCRGMQFLNVFFGGKVVKNIKEEITAEHSPGKDHPVTITEEKIISALGKKEVLVNSYHNQAVTAQTLSPQLKSFAIAEQDIIEGLYHPSLPIAGIQWHPERKSPDEEINKKLLEAFKEGKLFWGHSSFPV